MALTPYSWKIVTTANCSFAMPFECAPVGIWCDTPGVAKTATIEGIWGGGSLPLNSEIWVEVEYLQSGASPLAGFANDGPADLLEAGAAQTTSAASWSGIASINTTLNPLDKESHISLSGGNLTATGTAGWTGFVRTVDGRTTGKFYWECTFNGTANPSGVGVATSSVALSSTFNSVSTGHSGVNRLGNILVNGGIVLNIDGGTESITFGTITPGTAVCVAIDMSAKKIWYRLGATGNWNNVAGRNPATGVGGIDIPSVTTAYPTLAFGGADTTIANFGSAAFTGAVPSLFTAGFPILTSPFKLSTPFTPAQKGFIYARVKCARPSSTFYIDPRVTLS